MSIASRTARSVSASSSTWCADGPRSVQPVSSSGTSRSLPGATARLHARLEQRELVGPGREAALRRGSVELAQQGDHGVVRGLGGQVLDLVVRDVAQHGPAAAQLEARRAQQQLVQLRERGLAHGGRAVQGGEPFVARHLGDGGHRRVVSVAATGFLLLADDLLDDLVDAGEPIDSSSGAIRFRRRSSPAIQSGSSRIASISSSVPSRTHRDHLVGIVLVADVVGAHELVRPPLGRPALLELL